MSVVAKVTPVTVRWDDPTWRLVTALAAEFGMSANLLVNLIVRASFHGKDARSVMAGIGHQIADEGVEAWAAYLAQMRRAFGESE